MLHHTYKNALQGFTFIDLFAGIGAFHLALESFGATCVFASEWDVGAQTVYKDNFGIKPHGDITKIVESDIPKHHIVCAGFPCQPFSISGKQNGFQDTRGTLFFDVARIIKYHTPKIVLLENVKNFAHHDGGKTLKVVENTLQNMGYKVYHKVLNASHFGIPQNRERIYIIAIRNDIHHQDFICPTPPHTPVSLMDCMGDAQGAIANATITKPMDWKSLHPRENSPQNKPIRMGTYNNGGQGERVYSPMGHAVTLSAYGGGIGAKTGMYKVGDTVRKLTPRECARVSGFPETFKIAQNTNTAYKQFGNTIVVDVLQYIIVALIEQDIF